MYSESEHPVHDLNRDEIFWVVAPSIPPFVSNMSTTSSISGISSICSVSRETCVSFQVRFSQFFDFSLANGWLRSQTIADQDPKLSLLNKKDPIFFLVLNGAK